MRDKASQQKQLMRYLGHGPHAVEVIDEHLLHDASRRKDIPLRMYVPSNVGPHPVVLFSHGAGDSNATSPVLLRHWASHGFVVIAPTHLFGERPRIERSLWRLRKELKRAEQLGPEAWRERTGDLVAIMDNLGHLAESVPQLAGKVNEERIAVAGHSFGGYTVMLLGGATLTDPARKEVFQFSDPRPRAVLIISGPGRDHMGLTEDSWNEFTRPLMVMLGSRDPGYVANGGAMWRAEPYHYAPPGDKYMLYLRGAHHLSYVGPIFDLPLRDPARRGKFAKAVRSFARSVAGVAPMVDQIGLLDYSRIASVAFWNAYLNDDKSAKTFLQSHALETYSSRNARLSSR